MYIMCVCRRLLASGAHRKVRRLPVCGARAYVARRCWAARPSALRAAIHPSRCAAQRTSLRRGAYCSGRPIHGAGRSTLGRRRGAYRLTAPVGAAARPGRPVCSASPPSVVPPHPVLPVLHNQLGCCAAGTVLAQPTTIIREGARAPSLHAQHSHLRWQSSTVSERATVGAA